MTTLPERLLEMCRTPDGHDLPDHAEPWGADVATLREAAAALQAAPEGGGNTRDNPRREAVSD